MAKVLWVLAHDQSEVYREMIIYYTKWTMVICSGSLRRRGWKQGAERDEGASDCCRHNAYDRVSILVAGTDLYDHFTSLVFSFPTLNYTVAFT
jgi:hypothetical protein